MKILIDENLPKRLKLLLQDHDVFTVREMGWNGKSNGDLLKLMLEENFNVILTFDKNIEHQQNFKKFSIPVLVINTDDNTFDTIKKYNDNLLNILNASLIAGITKLL